VRSPGEGEIGLCQGLVQGSLGDAWDALPHLALAAFGVFPELGKSSAWGNSVGQFVSPSGFKGRCLMGAALFGLMVFLVEDEVAGQDGADCAQEAIQGGWLVDAAEDVIRGD